MSVKTHIVWEDIITYESIDKFKLNCSQICRQRHSDIAKFCVDSLCEYVNVAIVKLIKNSHTHDNFSQRIYLYVYIYLVKLQCVFNYKLDDK